ncbi:MAG: glycosyltransferase family 2 protein [Proteobacteria bacterium]|nr:glycosyltransferase family 2 protein [Pseudomonadota bacterium]
MILYALAILTLLVLLAISVEMAVGSFKLKNLGSIAPEVQPPAPYVSIIVPALNEETSIVEAMESLITLDYEHFEIIAINDRSTDQTGPLLDQFARLHSKIHVLHISELPSDWLGKQHALQEGADRAKGDLLLFTDADVTFAPSTLKRAIRRMQDTNLDHLTLLFGVVLSGSLLNMVVIEFGVNLACFLKPWKASDPKSVHSIGIGAFNLVRREAYEKIGGHREIAMSPIDDVLLGVLLKTEGFRQECLRGSQFVTVPWYHSLQEMIQGLEKNSFAALDYSMAKVAAASIFIIIVGIWPYWAVALTSGPTRVINACIIGCSILLFGSAAHVADIPKRHLLWLPVSPYIRLYTLWRAVGITLHQGGITWRGTFYPLPKLKARHIPIHGGHHGKRSVK